MSEIIDGVTYVDRDCVCCGRSLSVALSAVQVTDADSWPRCTDCLGMTAVEPEYEAWEIGREGNVAIYSKLHIWNATHTRMLCGVAPNWRIGNFGSSHSGECSRCAQIVRNRVFPSPP